MPSFLVLQPPPRVVCRLRSGARKVSDTAIDMTVGLAIRRPIRPRSHHTSMWEYTNIFRSRNSYIRSMRARYAVGVPLRPLGETFCEGPAGTTGVGHATAGHFEPHGDRPKIWGNTRYCFEVLQRRLVANDEQGFSCRSSIHQIYTGQCLSCF